MKKLSIVTGGIILVSFLSFSQASAQQGQRREAQTLAETMNLELTSEQAAKVVDINARLSKKIQALPPNLPPEARKKIIDQAVHEQLAELKAVLSQEQFLKFLQVKDRREREAKARIGISKNPE